MKNIAIIGCGGHSKVIIDIINEINNINVNTYKIIGIFDDYKIGYLYDIPILDKIYNIKNYNIESFIISIGNDKIREKIFNDFSFLKWETIIHPLTNISKNVKIGEGTVICTGCLIQTEVKIGKHCIINTGSSIDHESVIGDFSSICPKATICGNVLIGSCTLIGANSTIIQNISIGDNCIIGAGSVIIKNVENNSKIVGNPGRLINYIL